MKWETEEAMLLVDLYNYSLKVEDAKIEIAIATLSEFLKKRAVELGYKIDEKFRNETGIKMKLQNIAYIATDGEKGLSGFSEMDKKQYGFYIQEPQKFNSQVMKIKNKYGLFHDIGESTILDSDNLDAFINSKTPLFEICGEDPILYDDAPIRLINSFSIRVKNCFNNVGIKSIADLLKKNSIELGSIRGFGKNCYIEIYDFIKQIKSIEIKRIKNSKQIELPNIFSNHIDEICNGNFENIEKENLTTEHLDILRKMKEGYGILGQDLVSLCMNSPDRVKPIYDAFKSFVFKYDTDCKRRAVLLDLVEQIPKERTTKLVTNYIKAYSLNEYVRESLNKLLINKDFNIKQFVDTVDLDEANQVVITKFLKWCSFNINDSLDELFSLFTHKNALNTTLYLRAIGKTLSFIGEELGQTRESIRQKEKKIKKYFNYWQNRNHILLKISAERNGDSILTPSELSEYFGDKTEQMLFLLRNTNSSTYTYDSQVDVFIIGDESLSSRVQESIESLPDIFHASELDSIIKDQCEENDFPEEIYAKAICEEYSLTGITYHRNRLSLKTIYKEIFEKYYSEGLRVYDESEIKSFCEKIREEFGDIKLPDNRRAIEARLAEIGVLCGRGIYKPKQQIYISQELSKKIYDYIVKSDSNIFLMNTLYDVFEEELLEYGIDNKYYLQGVLRETFEDKFVFRRDYISKDNSITSLYSEIVKFIKEYEIPVTKEQIQLKFPGVTDVVISLATNDEKILKYYGGYYHVDRLKLFESDKEYLKKVVNYFISDNESHDSREIYNYIYNENLDLLNRLAINTQFSLFSVLEYLFDSQIQFDRPYIAKQGVKIGNVIERLKELVSMTDEILISDIVGVAKENKYQISSLLDFINGLNQTHIFKDSKTIISLDKIGFEDLSIKEIEEIILEDLTGTIPINQLTCINKFPSIKVKWNDWLIYSIVKKYSTSLDVATTSNQLKYAIPIIARKGQIDFNAVGKFIQKDFLQVDDLEDIDNLISGYIKEEME